jgi:hypothetical protein
MNIIGKYEKLMEFIYDEYCNKETFQSHGLAGQIILSEFQRFTGIRFGDANTQKAAIEYLFKQGWIDKTQKSNYSIYLQPIKPTKLGMEFVQNKRNIASKMVKPLSIISEIAGRFTKGFFGR